MNTIEIFEDIELTNNPIYEEENGDDNSISIDENQKEINIKHKIIELLIYFNSILSHVFVFSIFESLFFWFYITKEENAALERQFKQVIMMSNILCLNVDINLDPYYEYLKNERKQYNNDVSRNNTIVLNSILALCLIFINFLMKIAKLDIYEENKKVMRRNVMLFIILFGYEYVFFQTIVYNYKPESIMQVTKELFEQCVDDTE